MSTSQKCCKEWCAEKGHGHCKKEGCGKDICQGNLCVLHCKKEGHGHCTRICQNEITHEESKCLIHRPRIHGENQKGIKCFYQKIKEEHDISSDQETIFTYELEDECSYCGLSSSGSVMEGIQCSDDLCFNDALRGRRLIKTDDCKMHCASCSGEIEGVEGWGWEKYCKLHCKKEGHGHCTALECDEIPHEGCHRCAKCCFEDNHHDTS